MAARFDATGTRLEVAATNNLLLDLRAVRAAGLRFDVDLGTQGGEDTLFTRQLVASGGLLTWCAEAALRVQGRSARDVFGSPDDLKLRSSATLFAAVSPAGSVFHRLLDHYFRGEPDSMTLSILGSR